MLISYSQCEFFTCIRKEQKRFHEWYEPNSLCLLFYCTWYHVNLSKAHERIFKWFSFSLCQGAKYDHIFSYQRSNSFHVIVPTEKKFRRQLENSYFIYRVDNESNSSFSLFVWYVSFKCKIYKLVIVLNLLLSNRHTNKMDVKNQQLMA